MVPAAPAVEQVEKQIVKKSIRAAVAIMAVVAGSAFAGDAPKTPADRYPIEAGNIDVLIKENTAIGGVGDVITATIAVYGNYEKFSVLDFVFTWDPKVLTLATTPGDGHWLERYTVVDGGPYAWLINGFLADSNGDGLNDSLEDANAWYTAWARFDRYPVATPDGLVVGVFTFKILAPPAGTPPGRFGFTTIRFKPQPDYAATPVGPEVGEYLGSLGFGPRREDQNIAEWQFDAWCFYCGLPPEERIEGRELGDVPACFAWTDIYDEEVGALSILRKLDWGMRVAVKTPEEEKDEG